MSQSQSSSSQSDALITEIDVRSAYALLERDPGAQLVDVRTRAEWAFVGVPMLPFRGAEPIFLEWQRYPDMSVDPDFAARLAAEFDRRGVTRGSNVLFLCRSGARSRAAGAVAARDERGLKVFNVSEGFEGPLDERGHRGRVSGWRAEGLPWRQG
jgi:rhodanese-related sulfurtransferase